MEEKAHKKGEYSVQKKREMRQSELKRILNMGT